MCRYDWLKPGVIDVALLRSGFIPTNKNIMKITRKLCLWLKVTVAQNEFGLHFVEDEFRVVLRPGTGRQFALTLFVFAPMSKGNIPELGRGGFRCDGIDMQPCPPLKTGGTRQAR